MYHQLQAFVKQGYLERAKSALAAAGLATQTQGHATQRNKKGRATQVDDDGVVGGEAGDPGIEWRWGARAELELGEQGVAKFVQAIYESEVGAAQGATQAQRSGRGRSGEKLLGEIARSAGVKELAGVTGGKERE